MGRPVHHKKSEALTLLLAGVQMRFVSKRLGVRYWTLQSWKRDNWPLFFWRETKQRRLSAWNKFKFGR